MQTANGCRLCVQIKEERNKSHHPADLPPRFRTIRAQRQDPMGVERMFFNIHQCLPLKESSSQRFPRCKIRPSQCSRSWEGRMRSAHGADFPPRPGQLPDSPSPFKTHLGLVSRLRNFTQRPQAKTISSVIRTLLLPKVALISFFRFSWQVPPWQREGLGSLVFADMTHRQQPFSLG